jgi:hypothetical protein
MIPYVNELLLQWARWWLKADARQSVVSSLYRLRPGEFNPECATPEAVIPINSMDAVKTDRAICAIGASDPVLQDSVMAFYLRQSPVEYVARDFGVSRATFMRRIDTAHARILGYLNDIEAGVALPLPKALRVHCAAEALAQTTDAARTKFEAAPVDG